MIARRRTATITRTQMCTRTRTLPAGSVATTCASSAWPPPSSCARQALASAAYSVPTPGTCVPRDKRGTLGR
eukprot:358478-Chlamydomonas_euryale.AAC.16